MMNKKRLSLMSCFLNHVGMKISSVGRTVECSMKHFEKLCTYNCGEVIAMLSQSVQEWV